MPLPHTVAANLFPLGALAPTGVPTGPLSGGVAAVAGAAGGSKTLAYPREGQEQDNWCWAAVAVSVARYYTLASTWMQCELASQELSAVCCPPGTNPHVCDVPWYLDKALTRVTHYAGFISTAADYLAQVIPEIDAARPVAMRLEWAGSGGLAHFVALTGYDNSLGGQIIQIDDPAPLGIGSQSRLDYATFITMYQGSGAVTDTLWTKN